MTDDVVWTLPGTSLVSGIATGVEGILKRARTIHVPRWVGGLKVIRAFLPPIIELGSRGRIAAADKAALDDIKERGAYESAVTGHGGRAGLLGHRALGRHLRRRARRAECLR